jgi:hypothetical protein
MKLYYDLERKMTYDGDHPKIELLYCSSDVLWKLSKIWPMMFLFKNQVKIKFLDDDNNYYEWTENAKVKEKDLK